jgi:cellulose synthase operon protein B
MKYRPMKKRFSVPPLGPHAVMTPKVRTRFLRSLLFCGVAVLSTTIVLWSGAGAGPSLAQSPTVVETPAIETPAIETPVIETPVEPGKTPSKLPERATSATNSKPASKNSKLGPLSQYILEFNRSPEIGNRFRMEGVYAESRLGFTRPRGWNMKGTKALIRFQHSPSLVGARSNLVVRVNDTTIGSIPLNLKNSQIGEAMITIPPNLVQDYNEIALVAQQENSATCSNPDDRSLWTEVLPDSKVVFDYQPEEIPLDFISYPYPFFDQLGLEPTRLNYLTPTSMNEAWLTTTSRFQTQMGRLADFRPLETQLVKDAKTFRWNDRLVIIGTPEQQPLLKTLKLPAPISGNRFVDESKVAYGDDAGLLMLTTLQDGAVPVLIITGNSDAAVQKAAQFLVQPKNSQIGTSKLVVVNALDNPAAPDRRDWPRFLPSSKQFTLKDLKAQDGKAYKDVTVQGSSAPPVEFNFWALPDDRFLRGSTMALHYSYSAQADPKNSTISVAIDNISIGSKKLGSDQGGNNETFTVDLPENLVKPNSKIRVDFKLLPKDANEKRDCGRLTDQHLWGTLHDSTSFSVNREIGSDLPDLKLLSAGFPFTEMQDLSRMAIILPDTPSNADVLTLLKFSERMGRITRATSIRHEVFRTSSMPPDSAKASKHLVAIGTRDRLPLPQVFKQEQGFNLTETFNRQMGKTDVKTLPNSDGIIKTTLSPWSNERVLLALTAQTDQGLKQVQDVLSSDAWFYQLQGDTALMSATEVNPNPYDPNGYRFQFLEQSTHRTRENINPLNKMRRFLQEHFYLLPIGIILVSLLMYGIAQRYLKRVAGGSN